MNKIVITDEKIETNLENIKYKLKEAIVKEIYLDILNDASLEIEYNIKEEVKINIFISLKENVNLDLNEILNGQKFKIQNNYLLAKNSHINVIKINDGNDIKMYDLVNLDEDNSTIKYILKTVCTNCEKYDIVINHNAENTDSHIITNALNLDGSMTIDVTGYVPKGSINSNLIQDNRIINLTDNKCEIKPNLLIDEEIVNASHSAHISTFPTEDLFYLMSRGIKKEDATKLLIKGFLNSHINSYELLNKIIQKYWG